MTEQEVKALPWTKVEWPWDPMGKTLCGWTHRTLWFYVVRTDGGELYVVLKNVSGNVQQLFLVTE